MPHSGFRESGRKFPSTETLWHMETAECSVWRTWSLTDSENLKTTCCKRPVFNHWISGPDFKQHLLTLRADHNDACQPHVFNLTLTKVISGAEWGSNCGDRGIQDRWAHQQVFHTWKSLCDAVNSNIWTYPLLPNNKLAVRSEGSRTASFHIFKPDKLVWRQEATTETPSNRTVWLMTELMPHCLPPVSSRCGHIGTAWGSLFDLTEPWHHRILFLFSEVGSAAEQQPGAAGASVSCLR